MTPKSTPSTEERTPTLSMSLIFLRPHPERSPWWVRASRMTYSHVVLTLDDLLWDQPIDAKGATYDALEWLDGADWLDRDPAIVRITDAPYDPVSWLESLDAVSDRKGERLKTALRWLHLWPRPAWNCTSPIRVLCQQLGYDVTEETPDDIYRYFQSHPPDRDADHGGDGETVD